MDEKTRKARERGDDLLAAVESSVAEVHELELPLGKFRELATAKAWATNHGFSVRNSISTRAGFRLEVRRAEDFESGSLCQVTVGKSRVRAMIGTLKRSAVAKQVPDADASSEAKREAQAARAEEFGIEALDGKGENLSYPADFPTDLRLYGDPTNLKFPNDSEERAANARVRFKQFADTYELEKSKAIVHERIVRAELRHGITPGFDPEDPLDALLPEDLKDELSKAEKNLTPGEFAKRGEVFVVKQAEGGEDPDDEVRMIAVVMKPEIPDADGIVTSAEEIESANLTFMKDFGTVGFMHSKSVSDKVKIIQNVIAPVDIDFPLPDGGTKKIGKGWWYQELWSDDPDIVKAVKVDKTLTGLSIGGLAKTVPVTEFVGSELVVNVPENYSPAMKRAIKEIVAKAEGDPALGRFVDLRVQEVSLVDAAANEEEFFIIKRRKEMKTEKDKAAETKTDQVAPKPEKKGETTTPTPPNSESEKKGETSPDPIPKPDPSPDPAPEPTIAEQVAAGIEDGVKAALASNTPPPPAPEPTPDPAPETNGDGNAEVLVELKKINERIDGLEAAQKATGTARAVAKGEAAPEETATPETEPQKPASIWAGSVIHSAVNRK
jgi:hypothetical protein